MLVVETISKIRRNHFVKGLGIKTISRQLGISRNTVRKVIHFLLLASVRVTEKFLLSLELFWERLRR